MFFNDSSCGFNSQVLLYLLGPNLPISYSYVRHRGLINRIQVWQNICFSRFFECRSKHHLWWDHSLLIAVLIFWQPAWKFLLATLIFFLVKAMREILTVIDFCFALLLNDDSFLSFYDCSSLSQQQMFYYWSSF